MSTIAIHIGFHKSASTYLQENVFPKFEVNYFFLLGPAGESRKYVDLIQLQKNFDPNRFKACIEKEINYRFGDRLHEITLLSHEELSGHPHGYEKVDPYKVARNIKITYPQAKIIIVIRNQFEYLTSLYAYRVAIKGQETRGFEKFIEEEGHAGLFNKLEYHRLVGYYIELFGKTNVLVLPMELLRNNQVSFNNALADFIGAKQVFVNNARNSNKSTDIAILILFWRAINVYFNIFLNILRKLKISTREEFEYKKLRYIFYFIKRKSSSMLSRVFRHSRRININYCKFYDSLFVKYGKSNEKLSEIVEFDLCRFNYPLHK